IRSCDSDRAAGARSLDACRLHLCRGRSGRPAVASPSLRRRFALPAPSSDMGRDGPGVEGTGSMSDRPGVVYVVPDKMGGMMNIIANLLEYRRPDGFSHHAVLTHNQLHLDTRYSRRTAADTQETVE